VNGELTKLMMACASVPWITHRPRPLKQSQYPRAMTIALGILVNDAMILAADTEITVEGVMKSGEGKIRWVRVTYPAESERKWDAFAITGAGPTGYLDAVQQEALQLFNGHPDASIDELEDLFRKLIKKFYKDHITPFSSYGLDRPDFWLILAAERGTASGTVRRMWVSNLNTLRRVNRHAAVGIGEAQGMVILNRLALQHDADIGQLVAAYTIFDVKERIPGCGKDTDIICFRNGKIEGLHRVQLRQLEEVFRQQTVVDAMIVHRILGSKHSFAEADRIDQMIEDLREKVRDIIHPSSAISS
jgi:hypothetical protein